MNAESCFGTLDDVSHLLKVSDETIYSWIEKEGRPAIRTVILKSQFNAQDRTSEKLAMSSFSMFNGRYWIVSVQQK